MTTFLMLMTYDSMNHNLRKDTETISNVYNINSLHISPKVAITERHMRISSGEICSNDYLASINTHQLHIAHYILQQATSYNFTQYGIILTQYSKSIVLKFSVSSYDNDNRHQAFPKWSQSGSFCATTTPFNTKFTETS